MRTSLGISSALISVSVALAAQGGTYFQNFPVVSAQVVRTGTLLRARNGTIETQREKITRLVDESARHVADAAARPRFVAGPSAPSVSSR